MKMRTRNQLTIAEASHIDTNHSHSQPTKLLSGPANVRRAMTAAQTVQHDRDSISCNPTFRLVIMNDQSVSIGQVNRSLDRFVLRHPPWHQKRANCLAVTVRETATGDERRMVRIQQDPCLRLVTHAGWNREKKGSIVTQSTENCHLKEMQSKTCDLKHACGQTGDAGRVERRLLCEPLRT